MRRFLITAVLAGACGPTLSPYAESTKAHPIGDHWAIEIRGDRDRTPAQALEFLDTKATSVCPDGYDVLSHTGDLEGIDDDDELLTYVVRCKEAR